MASGRRVTFLPDNPFALGEEVQFHFEGRPVRGFSHEPLAVALVGAGVRIFGRSIKYHRPRGPVCMHGHCSGCLMRVDGVPNVRTCETWCRSGMVVERQSGWPSAGWDFCRAVDWLAANRLDHHGMFTASSTLNRLAGTFVRKMSGFGEAPTADPASPVSFSQLTAEVVVVGAGVCGLVASKTLAECGHQVVLLEGSRHVGGRLLEGSSSLPGEGGKPRRGWELLREWKAGLNATSGVEIRTNTPALAVYPGEPLAVLAGNDGECLYILSKRLLICTGSYQQVPLFPNNDLPGIFSLRALDLLVCGHAVVPAEPILLVGNSDHTLRLAALLRELQVSVVGVVTARREGELSENLKSKGVAIFPEKRIVRARGGSWLNRIDLSSPDGQEPDLVLDCQSCAVEAPEAPAYELAHHAGCRVTFRSENGYGVVADSQGQTSHSRVFAAGACTGTASVSQAAQQAERAALACSLSLKEDGRVSKRLESLALDAKTRG